MGASSGLIAYALIVGIPAAIATYRGDWGIATVLWIGVAVAAVVAHRRSQKGTE